MKKTYVFILAGLAIIGLVIGLAALKGMPKKSGAADGANAAPASVSEADNVYQSGDYIKARILYKAALESLQDPQTLAAVQKKIEDLNMKILFSPLIDEYSAKYKVEPNDSLYKIAKKSNTTMEFIQRANNLQSGNIVPGQELKVPNCAFSIVVDKSQNLLFLKVGDSIFKTYVVSTGKNNCTPIGKFKITANKLKDPTWYKTGAVIPPNSQENILGTRWMGLDLQGYGIHGTTKPEELGMQVTAGCVRMRNDEVEELYDIVPVGTEVTVVD